jgi:hypothetical protein
MDYVGWHHAVHESEPSAAWNRRPVRISSVAAWLPRGGVLGNGGNDGAC